MLSVFASTQMVNFTHYLKSVVELTAAVGQSCIERKRRAIFS